MPAKGFAAPKCNPNPYGRAGRAILKATPCGPRGGGRNRVNFNESDPPSVEFEPYIVKKKNQQISQAPKNGGKFTPINMGQSQMSFAGGSSISVARTDERKSERVL